MPLHLPEPERQAYVDGRAPAAHLDFLHAAGFRAAGAALRLGVFAALADGPLAVKELAARLDCDEFALDLLLRALAPFSYVEQVEGEASYRLGSAAPVGPYATVMAFWQSVLFEQWSGLEESVRAGRPADDFYRWLEARPETQRQFQSMLAGLCRMLTPEILDLVPVPAGPARLVDIGGGHAGYSIALCRRHPGLRATVLDLPVALATGASAIVEAGLDDRIEAREWDIVDDGAVPGGPYQIALLFNIVHGYGPAGAASVVRRAAEAIAPGGTIALLEPLDDPKPSGSVSGDAFVKLFSLNLFHGQGGRAYPYAELARWLTDAGMVDVRVHSLKASPDDCLVLATAPGLS